MAAPPAENSPATLVSQREFARQRGCSIQAVNRNTVDHGGVIPTYGAKKQIDPADAERLWPPKTNGPAPPSQARELDRQRVRKLKAEVARAELELRVRKGELLDRQKGLDTVFRFARMLRDRWQAWPAKIGPLWRRSSDPGAVIVVLEGLVREHLEELSSERCEF